MAQLVQTHSPDLPLEAASASALKQRRLGGLVEQLRKSTAERRYSNATFSKSTNNQKRGSFSTADDHSSNSTFVTIHDEKKEVRFASPAHLEQAYPPPVYLPPNDDEEEDQQLHYKAPYFRKLKSDLSEMADEARSQGYSSRLDFMYDKKKNNNNNNNHDESQMLLNEWVRKKEELRGLELLTKRRTWSKRQTDRIRHQRTVVQRYRDMTQPQRKVNQHSELQRVAEQSSRAAAVTARMFGIADEAAVLAEDWSKNSTCSSSRGMHDGEVCSSSDRSVGRVVVAHKNKLSSMMLAPFRRTRKR